MHSNWYIKIQRELQRPFPLLKSRITPKFRHFPTNTYQHKLWHFSTNTYPPNDPFPPPPHLFSQPKETSNRVASHLSLEIAPGKWATSSLSSCSLQWQFQGSKSVAHALELAPCHACRFHHYATEKIYTYV